jgi:HTH-type transcriptional regulator / antitoxin HigA
MDGSPQFQPNWAISPGATIARTLAVRNLSRSHFAEGIGLTLQEVSYLIDGELNISSELAERIADCLGTSAEFWANRQAQYDLKIATMEGEGNGSGFDLRTWLSGFPKRDMEDFGWIPTTRTRQDSKQTILDFFNVQDIEEWYTTYSGELSVAAFRTTLSYNSNPQSVASWLRAATLRAEQIDCGEWDAQRFLDSLASIRKLTTWKYPKVFIPELERICADCGVAVVVVPAPKGCRASGATKFLSNNKAMIALSLRYRTDDQFWFTFFHEAGHLILHGTDALFLEDGADVTYVEEEEANQFAEKIIVPESRSSELSTLSTRSKAVIKYAVQIGVAPGLIVGQLQHKGRITFRQLNFLKRRYKWDSFLERS